MCFKVLLVASLSFAQDTGTNGDRSGALLAYPKNTMALNSKGLPVALTTNELYGVGKCTELPCSNKVVAMPAFEDPVLRFHAANSKALELHTTVTCGGKGVSSKSGHAAPLYKSRSTCGILPGGPWAPWTPPGYSKCWTRRFGQLANLRPGNLVLDLGSACGYPLTMLAEWFGVQGVGVDFMQPMVDWANEMAANNSLPLRFCQGDMHDLDWLPSDTFHHAMSNAALMYTKTDGCTILANLIRSLKPGGLLYLGWNKYGPFHRVHGLQACIKSLIRDRDGMDIEIVHSFKEGTSRWCGEADYSNMTGHVLKKIVQIIYYSHYVN